MLPTIPHDKALHAVYGSALSLVGALIAHATQQPLWAGALILAVVFAVATEVRDRVTKRGTPTVRVTTDATISVVYLLGAEAIGFSYHRIRIL